MTATRARLSEHRWHLQHGPIDLIVGADGERMQVAAAHERAWLRFTTILDELVVELDALRGPVGPTTALEGVVARRMWRACHPHRARFITPMAAVAGAVADELIACYRCADIDRAWVNNGGDIALHLAPGASARVGLFADLSNFDPRHARGTIAIDGSFEVTHAMAVCGIATSGWHGRSFSLGIADSVTVLAATAADADAAATMIANAVDIDDPRIVRRPASSLKDDTDLGDLLVTVDVPPLGADAVDRALRAGLAHANALRHDGRIASCLLTCQRRIMSTDGPSIEHADRRHADAWHSARLNHDTRHAA